MKHLILLLTLLFISCSHVNHAEVAYLDSYEASWAQYQEAQGN